MTKGYDNEGIGALASAIIERAADDYIDGILARNGVYCGGDSKVQDFGTALTFFKSDWFMCLYPGKADPEAFIKKLNSDGVYMRCIRTYATNLWTINNSKSKNRVISAESINNQFEDFFNSTYWKDNVGISKEDAVANAKSLYAERCFMKMKKH